MMKMKSDDQAVLDATLRFYDAIEQMVSGQGLEAMSAAWHHTPYVTGGHPSGEWSQGWDEVWATWQLFSSFGRHDRGGSTVRNVKAHVFGDIAYATSTFVASPAFGGEALACTNVLQRIDGEWKVIHHHADKSPKMGAALEKIARGQ
jgi:hypothetical protein